MTKMKTYQVIHKHGIDDLYSEYAWRGASQGDNSVSNDAAVDQSWMTFVFKGIDRTDQKAIDAEVERRKQWNREYINELKEMGAYGAEYLIEISFLPCPLFDDPITPKINTESYRFELLDFSKPTNHE